MLRNFTVYSLLLVAIGVGTWWAARPPQRPYLPAYECVIPSTIPATMTYVTDGQAETVDTHAEYRQAHREGWDECLAGFVHNRCGRRLRHQSRFSSDLDIPFRQESWFTQQGRTAGYAACLAVLRMPDPDIGRSTAAPDRNWDHTWTFRGYRFAGRQD